MTTATASGTFRLGGEREVTRLGFGAMRITGEGIWGDPPDRETARAVVRRAVEFGVDLIDTADSYGPFVSEEIIREAIHDGTGYGDVLVATKGGLTRTGPNRWHPVGRPEYLRQCVEMSLRRLGVETIDLWQLHRVDREVPQEEQFGLLRDLVDEGKVRYVGLSEVGIEEIEAARKVVPIVSVQNRYNATDRDYEDVLDHCEANEIAFIPWFPLAAGELARPGGALATAAERRGVSPGQVALAWLLRRSPAMLPIPGTGSVQHLEENIAAAGITLDDDEARAIDDAVS